MNIAENKTTLTQLPYYMQREHRLLRAQDALVLFVVPLFRLWIFVQM